MGGDIAQKTSFQCPGLSHFGLSSLPGVEAVGSQKVAFTGSAVGSRMSAEVGSSKVSIPDAVV